jgi:dimethylamine/trimethylamine dehydrogenase
MGTVIAEKLRGAGLSVALVTPAAEAAAWTHATLEIDHILERLAALEIEILPYRNLVRIGRDEVELSHLHAGRQESRPAASVVLVTAREPSDALYRALSSDPDALATVGIKSVTRIGDCDAPGTIAAAVYAGHRYARELDAAVPAIPFLRERLVLHPSAGPTTRG